MNIRVQVHYCPTYPICSNANEGVLKGFEEFLKDTDRLTSAMKGSLMAGFVPVGRFGMLQAAGSPAWALTEPKEYQKRMEDVCSILALEDCVALVCISSS